MKSIYMATGDQGPQRPPKKEAPLSTPSKPKPTSK